MAERPCRMPMCAIMYWVVCLLIPSSPAILFSSCFSFSERPVMYSGSSPPAWGQFKLPHQIMSPVNSVGAPNPQMDFASELHRAVQNAKASYEN